MAKKEKGLQYYEGTGRRKESVARVRLYIADKAGATVRGKKIAAGEVYVNEEPVTKTFTREVDAKRIVLPLQLTDSLDRFAISVVVRGGGTNGRVEAIANGIAKALIIVDPETYKPVLRQHGFVTRDPRARERRKVGTGGKARRQKQSPKR